MISAPRGQAPSDRTHDRRAQTSRLHAVMPHHTNSAVGRRNQEEFPDACEHTDSILPVQGPPATPAPANAADIGVKGAGRAGDSPGAVF